MSTTPDSDAPNWMGLAVEATFDINHHPRRVPRYRLLRRELRARQDRQPPRKATSMNDTLDIVYVVLKVAEKPFEEEQMASRGVYPSGEVMGIHHTEGGADSQIQTLRANSPSDRFGESMEEAPYSFEIERWEVRP